MRLKGCHRMGRGALLAALTLLTGPSLAIAAKAAPVGKAAPVAKATSDTTAAVKAPPGAKATPVAKGAPDTKATRSTSDSSMTIRAGQSGAEFRSMTVEGEDRVHIDFGRPDLKLDLDPEDVPGLTRGTAVDVLDRTVPDLVSPLVALSAEGRSPYVARPWLQQFATGSVARFRPAVKGVVQWKLLVANSRGETVATFDGKGDPPKEITWDGRTKSGAPVTPGLTYSYVFEARDRAGNKRNFVGQGFTVSAYRLDTPDGPVLVLSGRDLSSADAGAAGYGPSMKYGSKEASPMFLEVASWLNQSPKVREPIRVAVTARTLDQASMLANRAVSALSGRVIGDPGRIQAVTEVAADAPEGGTLRIGMVK